MKDSTEHADNPEEIKEAKPPSKEETQPKTIDNQWILI